MTGMVIPRGVNIRSSDSEILEGGPPGEGDDPTGGGDDPTGEEDRSHARININPLRGESVGRTIAETRRFKEQDAVKVPKFPHSSQPFRVEAASR